MRSLRIALLQLAWNGDPAASGQAACREAAAAGADLAVFPEMWSVGYRLPEPGTNPAPFISSAIDTDDPFVEGFRRLAQELDMAIALTYLQAWNPLPRNVVSLIDRHGEVLFTYAKVHTCDWDKEVVLTPGNTFEVATLDTRVGPVEIGAMICFDALFPEAARILMLKGAEIVVVPNSSSMDEVRWSYLRVRAFENMNVIVSANYAAPDDDGGSAAYHPMAWEGEDGPAVDTEIVRAGSEQSVVMAAVDLDRLRAWRAAETQGDAYRKPAAYGPLLDAPVPDIFRRPDSRR